MNFLSEELVVKEAIASATKEILVNGTAIDTESTAIDILNIIQKDIALLIKSKVTLVTPGTTFTTTVSISHCETVDGTFVVLPDIVFKGTVKTVAQTATFGLIGIKHDQLYRYIKIKVSVNGLDGDTSVICADILAM